jgi:GNAT superfamily N-acetyltransferase
MPVRKAKEEDLMRLMDLCKIAYDEDEFAEGKPFSAKRTAETLVNFIGEKSCQIFVYEHKGEIVGVLAGYLAPYPWSECLQANEETLYVLPEFRGMAFAARLIQAFINWAEENSADVYFYPRSQIDQVGITKLLHGMGFENLGLSMVFRG